ncbi:hypothetical protein H0A36_22655 [Endozoicomonas sp. SM1973]|uniref:Bulb-type lectin domain-containing protein n=1 Tax=Spartinivicinus marinus TaxID=2994442 RepID=A0A853I668_9GAMM|nr:hypothetical protein [Spartinivicinus marinus]MCX4025907.1 hypothetical protein [Spartinivicinus marinus]NYZ68823.1 hypothetical protein [Spartinivicinus marinus]
MSNARALNSGQVLLPTNPQDKKNINEGLVSPNNQFQLQYQNDGNIVLYEQLSKAPREVVQNGGTNHKITPATSYAIVAGNKDLDGKYNGRLVIVDNGSAFWYTDAQGPNNCNLYLNNDGALYFALSEDGSKTIVDIAKGTFVSSEKRAKAS